MDVQRPPESSCASHTHLPPPIPDDDTPPNTRNEFELISFISRKPFQGERHQAGEHVQQPNKMLRMCNPRNNDSIHNAPTPVVLNPQIPNVRAVAFRSLRLLNNSTAPTFPGTHPAFLTSQSPTVKCTKRVLLNSFRASTASLTALSVPARPACKVSEPCA
jgi:hypothetical protein